MHLTEVRLVPELSVIHPPERLHFFLQYACDARTRTLCPVHSTFAPPHSPRRGRPRSEVPSGVQLHSHSATPRQQTRGNGHGATSISQHSRFAKEGCIVVSQEGQGERWLLNPPRKLHTWYMQLICLVLWLSSLSRIANCFDVNLPMQL